MRPLILKMSVTADGFVCGPKGEIHWLFESSTPDSKAWVLDIVSSAGAHLMGSKTYQDMAAYWPQSTDVFAPAMNSIPKVIFTRRSGPLTAGTEPTTRAVIDAIKAEGPGSAKSNSAIEEGWRNPRVARGDMKSELLKLKAEGGGPLLAHGGYSFARSLIGTGLVDEIRLAVHPVIIGKGESIFTEVTAKIPLELVSSTSFKGGVVGNIYRPKR